MVHCVRLIVHLVGGLLVAIKKTWCALSRPAVNCVGLVLQLVGLVVHVVELTVHLVGLAVLLIGLLVHLVGLALQCIGRARKSA
jgi:hypothetical protein